MNKYCYTVFINVVLLTIPMYVIYDGMMTSAKVEGKITFRTVCQITLNITT